MELDRLYISKQKFKKIFDNYELIEREIEKQNKEHYLKIDQNCRECYVFNTDKEAQYFLNVAKTIAMQKKRIEHLQSTIRNLLKIEKQDEKNFYELENEFYYKSADDNQKDVLNASNYYYLVLDNSKFIEVRDYIFFVGVFLLIYFFIIDYSRERNVY
jgi:hypothetical protein